MKQALKIVGGFLIGILMGLVVAGVGLVLFGNMSFSEYIGKFLRLNVMEVIGIPLLSLFLPDSRFLASRPARSGAFGLRAGFGLPFRIVPHLQLYMDTPRWEGTHETL